MAHHSLQKETAMTDQTAVTLNTHLPALIIAVEKVAKALDGLTKTFQGSDPVAVNLQSINATLAAIQQTLSLGHK
jgi:uncharacterized coiled-coil protein SlyX